MNPFFFLRPSERDVYLFVTTARSVFFLHDDDDDVLESEYSLNHLPVRLLLLACSALLCACVILINLPPVVNTCAII